MRGHDSKQKTASSMSKEPRQMNPMAKPSLRPWRAGVLAAVLACVALFGAAPAQADYAFDSFDVEFTDQNGSPVTQAGSHPFAMTTSFEVASVDENEPEEFLNYVLSGRAKDLFIEQIAGFVGDATVVPRCSSEDFLIIPPSAAGSATECPDSTVVGVNAVSVLAPIAWIKVPVYNLEPPPGVQARLGFVVVDVPVTLDVGVKHSGDYNVRASLRHIPQPVNFFGSIFQLWGDPSDPAHDELRGLCSRGAYIFVTIDEITLGPGGNFEPPSGNKCPVEPLKEPFLTVPRSCAGPLATNYETDSWQNPGDYVKGSALTHDDGAPPSPQGFTGCGKLPFNPEVSAVPTSASAESPSGLDFALDFNQEGLTSLDGLAQSEIQKTVVTLPEGVTINPSIGEGLGFCSPADYERESLAVGEGKGCPNSAKLGTVHVESPLIETPVEGSLYLAQQDDPTTSKPGAENPFDSLIALYIVLRSARENILVKLPAKVEPDPKTGQLVTTVEDIPQLPFSHFNLHFREGLRAPLTTPPACGKYDTVAKLTPHANPDQVLTTISTFEITGGIDQGPCPPGGVPPFKPHFEAGSLNNNAKSFSPFNMRLIRGDGEQDMTKFSSVLPPGVLGKLAGVDKCPDAAIEATKAKTGREELAAPSCPANSQIGRTLAGAGVGSALTYVGGSIYLGGPYKGAPLSVVSVTPAVAGPFDAGTVVVRLGLTLNPVTAEVEVDGAASDPIPHILKGIPLKVRDLRVYVDRPNFILNPTSCDPSSAKATLFGGFLDLFSPADDVPVDLATRYQAANCLNLGFKPNLKLNLRGGTQRGDHPGLKAVLKARPGDANIAGASVTLPRSAFLDQSHIRTICTRVQYAADQCPKGSIYGRAKAITPLLDDPIEGNVYLRSSSNKLPDLVIALKGIVDVDVSSRIDSKNGGIRNTFDVVPDAPVKEFVLTLQGGKKGLIVNSRDLCEGRRARINARFLAQNGKARTLRPELEPQCGGRG
jgi:hypothetical protein